MKPLARKNGIFVENLPEEVVLYDKTHDKVHNLNKTATTVWENSDGSKTVDELTKVVEIKTGAPANRNLVLQALEELDAAGLMEAGVVRQARPSRREAVGKMVMAGSALVATIIAAPPKAHASGGPGAAPQDPIHPSGLANPKRAKPTPLKRQNH